ncbi:class I SAM-dependent methyltransferase [Phycisphaera mikurensis]|uniref:Methyltransferase n=1 Tax=Phycisphaera mikurensis (strain NBRC 102666 / KCTC 22515 / FYK2301M01) TaxID=1142394 RepID=I0IHP7_PHYMF|nr:class I SAM-dependent methyltransferase [Phycisphaera mikurensis]MBB6441030.1 SAM-dependent methyltransferase [Phycisphaera mikurensis]BAM04785.1 hypothetical protein PSMK_26260 [Phycisphaera mikurensis NBRC 102666]
MLACPICGGLSPLRFRARGVPILGCGRCGHRFAGLTPPAEHVAATYGDDYFTGGGDGYPDYLADGHLVTRHARPYAAALARRLREDRQREGSLQESRAPRVLDVGAAAGFTLRAFAEAGFDARGLEPNPRMAAHARDRLGLTVEAVPLEDYADAEATFDAVTMIQVLPHLYDLPAALRRAAAATRPGGYWLIETWDRASLTARLAGERWHEYSPPSVLHYFSRRSLRWLCAGHGFDAVAAGRPRKRISVDHARSLLAHKRSLLAKPLAWLPCGLTLPYPGNDLFWMLFRKRKPGLAAGSLPRPAAA